MLLIVQTNFLFQEELIHIRTCSFLLWEPMLLMISILEVKLHWQEEQLLSLILQFHQHNKQCQLLIKDGEAGQTQR